MTQLLTLAEVADINPATPVAAALDELCSFVPMEAVDETTAAFSSLQLRPYREVAKGYTVFAENDVLLAKITPCMENGKCAIARGLTRGVGFGTTEFHVVRASKQILPEWIHYFWRLPRTRLIAERSMTGSAGQRRVPSTFLHELQLPVPSLTDQQLHIQRLDAADALRRTRRYALRLCDEFLPAAFLELFGDPAKNPRGFDLLPLEEELDRIESGYSPVCEGPRHSATEWAVLGLGAVTWGRFDPTANKRLPADELPRTDLEVRHGDLLVTRKNTYDLVAASALVRNPPPRLLLPDTIFRFRLREGSRLSPSYLWALFSFPSFKAKVQALAAGSAGSMPGISKEKFMTVRCPAPSSAAQEAFQKIIDRSIRLREQHTQAIRQADHLFQTLLHEAFTAKQRAPSRVSGHPKSNP